MVGWLSNNELESMRKETFMTWFEMPAVGYTILTVLSICRSVCIIAKSLQEYFDGNMWLCVYAEVHTGNVN